MTTPATETGRAPLAARVEKIALAAPVFDIHTHLYDPAFGGLLLWGIDDLLVYHYLVAEVFRYLDWPWERFWGLTKTAQADLIWKELFLQRSPISESCRGVLTTLNRLGLEVRHRDLPAVRRWFAQRKVEDHLNQCLELAGIRRLCMTNSPFDDQERPVWERDFPRDERFVAALRIDPLLVAWHDTEPLLARWGYEVGASLTGQTLSEVRRFLDDWTRRIKPKYLMVSLPPEFVFPCNEPCAPLLEDAVLPHCRDHGLPFALMLGARRAVNPELRLAGDGVGGSRMEAVENLCARFPQNKFLVTVLARENQHQLCVAARKFRNLHPFGCWWFTNVPYLVDEMTRLELIGLSVTPQHSDARVLDQVVYKWDHSRRVIARVLAEKYTALAQTGWEPSDAEIDRDVRELFGGAFERFCGR
jgi:hypothetical protein